MEEIWESQESQHINLNKQGLLELIKKKFQIMIFLELAINAGAEDCSSE